METKKIWLNNIGTIGAVASVAAATFNEFDLHNCSIAQLNERRHSTIYMIWIVRNAQKKCIFMRYLTYINSFSFAFYSEVSRDLFSDGRRRRHSKHLKLNTKFLRFIKRNRLAPVWCFRSPFFSFTLLW